MAYQVKAAEVSKLRNETGAGMMDCKKALVEAEGDFDKAIELLRKKGQKVAAKRADRETSEGAVIAATNADNTKGAIVALGCETDFVAKGEGFVALAKEFANHALNFSSKEDFLASEMGGMTVADKLTEQTGVIGEKLDIKFFETLEAPFVGSYIHNGNKIAALVGLSESFDNAAEVAKNVSMQVAAMNPIALDESKVDQAVIDKEVEIAKEQLRQEGKPEAMLDNIAKGKLNKFFKETTLVNQEYIMGDKVSVKDYVNSEKAGVTIVDFVRVAI
ncbi:translation elongation factor Ts [Ornithobacterium rhinotracheale]|uniref:Elongation factor Ts n=1 Tax=Ornithobacterium rhinotracheale (strain ATCC 51463 / DSM 15997 / CCUG 23171 / CIP 104009 / LMG 9086) TaxID=867902 RepID=I4A131_ORNRL|nr:translation elongation factor Ts [Ornithobacterium rhinotracheale]AFL97665.1 translation elongation factor Ts (EF-Ts) [Ornithobacterium rhinotracheale DSM 15997]AIP98829.1 elongation factor Ts [Ornithobacterium rhinotracheale ORT-UMN 88]KGB66800.1 elongation factor Ts [Ornithobacterium rhinotracheale H06-030791]MBN3661795.1 elongation factor Ts [Ornithobacterium rhinotracheale]MCK0195056.1 translation elongation factor Ts [Ornithobacterium rhinotracheale]